MSEPTLHGNRIVSPRIYFGVFAALLLLTGVNVGVSYLHLGAFNGAIALTIAVVEAVLVILFFMHVRYSSRVLKLTVVAGIFTLAVLLTMSMSDYISRAWGLW